MDIITNLFKRVPQKEVSFFTRQMAVTISSGVPLVRALTMIAADTKNKYFKQIIQKIITDIEEGESLSHTLAKYPKVFNEVYISVVKSGEASGKLEQVLQEMAERMEDDVRFNTSVRSALVYPIFIVIAMIIIGGVLMVRVIPQLESLFKEAGAQLPFATRVLIGTSHFLQNFWWLAIIIVILAIFALRLYLKTPNGERVLNRLEITLPLLKNVSLGIYMTRFSRTFSILIQSGVPIIESVNIISKSMNNAIYEDIIKEVEVKLEKGIPMSVPLAEHPREFPTVVSQMVSVGEQTGKLDEIFATLATYYEEQTTALVRSVSSLIEPILIIIIGLGVGFMVFSVLVPIYQVASFAG